MKVINPKTIIISRTDSIGDVVLTLPLAGILKQKFPSAKIIFLGNTYTKPIIKCSAHVDEIYEWSKIKELDFKEQVNWLKTLNADVFIHVFPRKELAKLAKAAKVPFRIGTSHRLYHWWTCNKKVDFTRKNSDLHEAQLNTKLLFPLAINNNYSLKELTDFTGFNKIPTLKEPFKAQLNTKKKNLIFHCKSQGSALEWGVNNFISLAKKLDQNKFNIFFTGTEGESKFFRHLLPNKENIIDLSGKMTLDELVSFISKADLLLAASTGPLHIAGLCNVQTIGLFLEKRPIHPGRWQPLGENVSILKDDNNPETKQFLNISVEAVLETIQSITSKH
ncbi:MAG: heptosyltransferase-3 [Planctomycetota bacterium]